MHTEENPKTEREADLGPGASETEARPDEPVVGEADGQEAGASGAQPQPDAEVSRLEAEKAELTDRLVRLAADMENLRKRTERDVADARRYAVSRFAADMLTVGDNLKRAIEAVPADARAEEGPLKAFVEGVEVTERELHRLLDKHGVKRMETQPGARFDPHLHQAMFEVPDETVPAGTVLQVVQDGFMIGDRVLRAAMVGVSRGGPKAGAQGGGGQAEPAQ